MRIVKTLDVRVPVKTIRVTGDGRIAVGDVSGGYRLLDKTSFKVAGGIKISLHQTVTGLQDCTVSPDGRYAVTAVPKTNDAMLWDLADKQLKATLSWHKGEIEAVACDPNGHYAATGGTDGLTFLWSLATGKLAGSLPPHADFVTAVAFSANGQWIATGSYDRTVKVTNIASTGRSFTLYGSQSAPLFLAFLPDFRLLGIDKEGHIILWDILKTRVASRPPHLTDTPTAMTLSDEGKFAFVALKNGHIALIDLADTPRTVEPFFRYTPTVTALDFDKEGALYCGDTEGHVVCLDLAEDISELDSTVRRGDIKQAYALIDANPILRHRPVVSDLEARWDELFVKAIALMQAGKEGEAKTLLTPFMGVADKRLAAQQLSRDFKDFGKFKTSIETKKYMLAYAMAGQYPLLKETVLFKQIEKEWQKAYARAKELMAGNAPKEAIREVFSLFRGIPQKTPLIQMLLDEKDLCRIFTAKLATKEYKTVFELAARKPFLKDMDEYKTLIRGAAALMATAKKELRDGDYFSALKKARFLTDFPDLAEESRVIIERADVYATMMQAKSANDMARMMQLVKDYPYLEETEGAILADGGWQKRVVAAEDAGAAGDIAALKQILRDSFDIPERAGKIGSLFAAAYAQQLSAFLASKPTSERLERGLGRYCALFGCDENITALLEKAKHEGYALATDPLARTAAAVTNYRGLPASITD